MKIKTITEAQARTAWHRLIALQRQGYVFLIKRRGRVVARLEPLQPTIASSRRRRSN